MKSELAIGAETGFRGYQGLGANVTRYDGGFQRDRHEALDLYREEDPVLLKARPKPFPEPQNLIFKTLKPHMHEALDLGREEDSRDPAHLKIHP